MAELTEREHDVYEAIRDGKTFRQIAEELGVTPQRVDMICSQLRHKGVIRRRDDLPTGGRLVKVYPWELVDDQPPTYKPALPPLARLRLAYPQDTSRDYTVPPIRHVRWGSWSVQGIPMLRSDGRPPYEALPAHRVVVVAGLEPDRWLLDACWVAATREPWTQGETRDRIPWVLTFHERRPVLLTREDEKAITLMIAAAVGVDAVMDLNDKEPHQ